MDTPADAKPEVGGKAGVYPGFLERVPRLEELRPMKNSDGKGLTFNPARTFLSIHLFLSTLVDPLF